MKKDDKRIAEIQAASAALTEALAQLNRGVFVDDDDRTVNVYIITNHGWIYPPGRTT